jgi:hypothetical protein
MCKLCGMFFILLAHPCTLHPTAVHPDDPPLLSSCPHSYCPCSQPKPVRALREWCSQEYQSQWQHEYPPISTNAMLPHPHHHPYISPHPHPIPTQRSMPNLCQTHKSALQCPHAYVSTPSTNLVGSNSEQEANWSCRYRCAHIAITTECCLCQDVPFTLYQYWPL